MPTTITSAGITFNDATSLTSGTIGNSQIANGAVTVAKLGTTEQKQIAKAWVNFNGTTSPGTIRSSYNVSSITKNGTGDYSVNFAIPMSDANYSVCGTLGGGGGTPTSAAFSMRISSTLTTNSNVITSFGGGGTAFDSPITSVQVFGN